MDTYSQDDLVGGCDEPDLGTGNEAGSDLGDEPAQEQPAQEQTTVA